MALPRKVVSAIAHNKVAAQLKIEQKINENLKRKLDLLCSQPEVKELINKWTELGEVRNY